MCPLDRFSNIHYWSWQIPLFPSRLIGGGVFQFNTYPRSKVSPSILKKSICLPASVRQWTFMVCPYLCNHQTHQQFCESWGAELREGIKIGCENFSFGNKWWRAFFWRQKTWKTLHCAFRYSWNCQFCIIDSKLNIQSILSMLKLSILVHNKSIEKLKSGTVLIH